jgi:hypothetical protein
MSPPSRSVQRIKSFALAAATAALCIFALSGCEEKQVADYCAIGDSRTLFFIDETTPYDSNDREKVRRLLTTVIQSIGPGDRLTLQTIGAHYSLSRNVFDSCKPGCPPHEANMVEAIVGGTCSTVRVNEESTAYLKKLISEAQPLLSNKTEATHSDIIDTIARVTQAVPLDRPYTEIILYTDLLENSPSRKWTYFRDTSDEKLLEELRRDGLMPALQGATVRIFGFGRFHSEGRPALSTEDDVRLRTFWTEFLTEAGAAQVLFDVPPPKAMGAQR